tara:strand:+ start:1244 stop:1489 length:246 start_codon:yes stop_codon:yes gene_type:complete
MPLFGNKNKEDKDKEDNKESKKEERGDKKEKRRTFRLEKIRELTAKFYAVAAKRKWLTLMIVAAIAAYLIFKGVSVLGLGG